MKKTTNITLGMPELNYNGLDEVWVLKHCGNIHWDLLKKKVDMYSICGRFYASFFHVSLRFETDQSAFTEQQVISIESELTRYSTKIYRSVHKFNGCVLIMDTMFVKKDDTGALTKYTPIAEIAGCKRVSDIGLKQYHSKKLIAMSSSEKHQGNLLVYPPSTVFNGVKLLYFANYLYLSLLSEFVQHKMPSTPIKMLDIYYYGNMSYTDSLYGRSVLHDDDISATTYLSINNIPISQCEIYR